MKGRDHITNKIGLRYNYINDLVSSWSEATTFTNDEQITWLDDMCNEMDVGGLFDKSKYLLAVFPNSQNASLLDVIGLKTATKVGNVTLTSQGWKDPGNATQYIKTGFNPTTEGMDRSSFSMHLAYPTSQANIGVDFGTGTTYLGCNVAGLSVCNVAGSGSFGSIIMQLGNIISVTADGTTVRFYINGVFDQSIAQNASALPNLEFYLTKVNPPANFASNGGIIQIASVSNFMTGDEITSLHSIFDNFLQRFGNGVL